MGTTGKVLGGLGTAAVIGGGVAYHEGIPEVVDSVNYLGESISNIAGTVGDKVSSVLENTKDYFSDTDLVTLLQEKSSETIDWLSSTPDFLNLGAGVLGAGILSNKVLKDLGLKNKFLRYSLSATASGLAYMGGTAATPYILGAGAGYWALKHGFKFGKNAGTKIKGTTKGAVDGFKTAT